MVLGDGNIDIKDIKLQKEEVDDVAWNSIQEMIIKGKKHKIIEGILTYIPEFCPNCGCINESTNDIIKWGFKKNCKVRMLALRSRPPFSSSIINMRVSIST